MFNVSIRKATSLDAEAIASVHVHSWKKPINNLFQK